jgi:hypothetical protein
MKFRTKREYIKNMTMLIMANTNYVKKRLAVFPIKTIKKVEKMELTNNITVQGKDYDSSELLKLIREKYTKLNKDTRMSSYSDIMRNFKKELTDENDLNEVWKKYQGEVRTKLEEDKKDMYFCLDAIKELSKKR